MHMPCLTRWETTARATSAPLVLNASIQSLSTMPAFFASISLIHTVRETSAEVAMPATDAAADGEVVNVRQAIFGV